MHNSRGRVEVDTQQVDRSLVVFVLVFAYTLLVGLLIQKLVLPVLLPHLHAGHGLLRGGDSIGFHTMASALADQVGVIGWSVWELRPASHAPVGIAAAIYATTGIHEPWVMLPLNATLFALSAAAMFRIVVLVTGNFPAASAAIVPFVLYPSAAMAYADMYKDVWSCAGSLLIFSVWAQLEAADDVRWSAAIRLGFYCFLGALLVWVVRAYFVKVLVAVFISVFLMRTLMELISKRGRMWALDGRKTASFLLCLAVMLVVARMPTFAEAQGVAVDGAVAEAWRGWSAASERNIWRLADDALKTIAFSRLNFLAYLNAGSMIDADVVFRSANDVLFYIPRALQIGLFAPFPTMWFTAGVNPAAAAMRAISGIEMAISYVLLAGIVVAIPRLSGKQLRVAAVALLSCILTLLIMASGIPNIGTLYRMRYGFLMLPVGLGAAGWVLAIGWLRLRCRNVEFLRTT